MADFQKQTVQWFPGHMAKTRRKIKENLPLVDAVVEIIDARIPISSRNPELDELTSSKPRIILLNKCDVADKNATALWIKHFEAEGKHAIPVDCKSGKGLNKFDDVAKVALREKIQSNIEKGMPGKALRFMVVGIPNTGKSTFINKMSGRNRLKTADKPGVTRTSQWVACGNGIELLDTPGVLWPKFDDPAVGDKLAFIGSVKDEILDSETIAVRLLDVLKVEYKDCLLERYKITPDDLELESYELLEQIGAARGMKARGGCVDTERAAVTLLDEYRGGKLGQLTFERPSDL
ncbi:MAG: ribosome biogenesis GTPase YlqF [Oscillospiraceae bacterium]|nr:ribosome biogenesis GTPase YlqF [Candidatus Limimonas coprohippi]